jgi:hypothetical protein
MTTQDEKEHEHARLVLMLADGPFTGFMRFANEMREEWPEMSLILLKQIYTCYCGWDGRVRPILSIETGKRL